MTEQLIPIYLIDANPYQPRKVEDSKAVEELALDILHHATEDFDGLMQAPTVRAVNGRYQLAFGHTRKASFQYLVDAGQHRYEEMRAIVRDLSDVQMFELAVAENLKRRDLNPLEQADAMRMYMDTFGKTSHEAGEFFGVAEETIRQKVRLLNLPERVQEKVREGTINENAARSLLTLVKVLPTDEVALGRALSEIEDGERPEDAVEESLQMSDAARIIREEQFSTRAKTFKYMPTLTPNIVGKALDWTLWIKLAFGGYGTTIKEALEYLKLHLEQGTENDNGETVSPELIERFEHFIKPPACTACPWFAKIDGTEYCGWSECFDRKLEGHQLEILHKTSEESGIAILSEDDGKHIIELSKWAEKHMKYFEKKGADLRLKLGKRGYGSFPGIPDNIGVVAVGKTMEAWKKQDEQSAKDRGKASTSTVDYRRMHQIENIKEAQAELFVWQTAAPAFASMMADVKSVMFLEALVKSMERFKSEALPTSEDNEDEREKMSKPARLGQARNLVMFYTIFETIEFNVRQSMNQKKNSTALMAKHLKGLATTWGVKLPKDFDAKAEEHDKAVQLEIDELDKQEKAE